VHLSLKLPGQAFAPLFQLPNSSIRLCDRLFERLQYGIPLALELPSLDTIPATLFLKLLKRRF
jgi:hypothetical protein